MFKKRSQQAELMDDLALASDDLRKNLDEIIFTNYWFGSKKTLLTALDTIYQKHKNYFNTKKSFIADLATGGGDLLEAIYAWSKKRKLEVELIGIDANPFMVKYASQRFRNYQYKIANILEKNFLSQPLDIACLNSVCHHFTDEELIKLLKQLKEQTQIAIIINDLRRHWLSYFITKVFTKLFNTSSLIKHDAPLSILRAFQKEELIKIFQLAEVNSFEIKRAWAFRWRIIIWSDKV